MATLNLPNGAGVAMSKTDSLTIIVTQTCTWCYDDPNGVFSSLLAPGTYTATQPPTQYGPYTPQGTGTVIFNAVTSGDCTTATPAATPRSITVS